VNRGGRAVALEGPVCAGKTTLGRWLVEDLGRLNVGYVEDYAEHVGGGRFLPPPMPTSLAEEERALGRLLAIEADRTAHVRDPDSQWGLIIVDRSVHTLLAHCHALTRMRGIDFFGLAQRLISSSDAPLWPDRILYLDVTGSVIDARNAGKFQHGNLFVDTEFNVGFREYFVKLARRDDGRVIWLDAAGPGILLQRLAKNHVAAWM